MANMEELVELQLEKDINFTERFRQRRPEQVMQI